VHAKNQDRSPRKISRYRQFFSAGFIAVSRDFTPYFYFRSAERATFDRNLIHSADAFFLVMACAGYSRAQLNTLSSLLKARLFFFIRPIKYLAALLFVTIFKWLSNVITRLQLLRKIIGWKISIQFFQQMKRKNQTQSDIVHSMFPVLWASHKYLLGILFGSSRCLLLLRLVAVITLELHFRLSLKNTLNIIFVGAMINPFQRHVRLCELVKASLILHLRQGLHFYPYDMESRYFSSIGLFLCQAEGGTQHPRCPESREYWVRESVSVIIITT